MPKAFLPLTTLDAAAVWDGWVVQSRRLLASSYAVAQLLLLARFDLPTRVRLALHSRNFLCNPFASLSCVLCDKPCSPLTMMPPDAAALLHSTLIARFSTNSRHGLSSGRRLVDNIKNDTPMTRPASRQHQACPDHSVLLCLADTFTLYYTTTFSDDRHTF